MELFIYVFAALFSVINPLGTVPIFVGLTRQYSALERSKTSLLTAINIFVILVISFFTGRFILHFFGISIESLRIAGGLIIVTSGFALLTGSFSKHKGMEKERVRDDVFQRESVSLTPLAIPMLAGPGSISLLIGMYEDYSLISEKLITIFAILGVCLATFLVLRSAHYIVKMLGASGINAISRIIGFIVIAIGIEYISSSVIAVLSTGLN
ncbi:multiple antibiotic resistance protein [Salegentibacter sp. 24]|uniref:MarC family protein n=1 Tax=Salegentibacter sp. 24 TaxID=2183986 RepID=UPI00106025D3|nr:NAAT family transporter [Salegentibacter sp. 24]TDN84358.1 multiple antibiotic resistance protein [Salegentibacter sp. 24]